MELPMHQHDQLVGQTRRQQLANAPNTPRQPSSSPSRCVSSDDPPSPLASTEISNSATAAQPNVGRDEETTGCLPAMVDTEGATIDRVPRTSSPRAMATSLMDLALVPISLSDLPNELLLHVLGFLDVSDLLSTSRTNHHLRSLSLLPILHAYRLRRSRQVLMPLLTSPSRPSLADLMARSIFLTHTTLVSRRLARSLAAIRLGRHLAARPSPEALVQRCVLPPECVPGSSGIIQVAPSLVARRRAIEKERVKDGLRRWVGAVWRGEVEERGESVRQREERAGVGRVWRLRKFWERIGRGENMIVR